jgi:hypothetical protein
MRFLILATLAILATALSAADQPPQLDPRKPADAIAIVDGLTRQLALPRDQAVGLTVAIETLAGAVRQHGEFQAALAKLREQMGADTKAAEPKPVEPAKPKD